MDLYTANKLLELRKKNNLSQEELANKLNISRQAISKWERAESSPDTDNLIALAKLYRISLDELFEINVKTFVRPDDEKDFISLKKEEVSSECDDELNSILSQRFSEPDEIYPQFNNSDKIPQAPADNSVHSESINSEHQGVFNAENYKSPDFSAVTENKISVIPPKKNMKKSHKRKVIDFYNSDYNYKMLYLFPYYAVAAVMFFLGMTDIFDISLGYAYLSDMSYIWWLTIPLYYTGVAALQKKNMNCFCYPVLAVILFLILMHITGSICSLIAFATIPFYYFIVALKREKRKKH